MRPRWLQRRRLREKSRWCCLPVRLLLLQLLLPLTASHETGIGTAAIPSMFASRPFRSCWTRTREGGRFHKIVRRTPTDSNPFSFSLRSRLCVIPLHKGFRPSYLVFPAFPRITLFFCTAIPANFFFMALTHGREARRANEEKGRKLSSLSTVKNATAKMRSSANQPSPRCCRAKEEISSASRSTLLSKSGQEEGNGASTKCIGRCYVSAWRGLRWQ